MARSRRFRLVLVGLLVGLSVLATTAGCGAPDSTPAAIASPTPSAEPLAPKVVAQVLRQRNATVKVSLQVGGSGGRAELSGPVEYTGDGVRADLTGTVEGDALHLIVLGGTVYVSGLFQLPAGTTWLKMAVGGERDSDSYYWLVIDEILTALTYVTDESLLAGLVYNSAPAENLNGVSVRTAVRDATRSDMVAKLKPAQLSRYEERLNGFTGARIILSVGEDAIPQRLVVTFTGMMAYPTIELNYTNWATTTVAIQAPSGRTVSDYP